MKLAAVLCVQRMQAPKLMPTEPALLHEAACWVDTWQEPIGHTNYEAALQLAERYLEADCLYIFSDGLSDYAVVLLEVRVDSDQDRIFYLVRCNLQTCSLQHQVAFTL